MRDGKTTKDNSMASQDDKGKTMDEKGNVLLWTGKNEKDCVQTGTTY